MSTVSSFAWIANTASPYFAAKALHRIGSNYYVVAQETSPGLTVYKSNDDGSTWTEPDSSHRQTITGVARPYDALTDGTTIYVPAQTGSNAFTCYVYDVGTDLWTTSLGTVTTVADTTSAVRICRRSDGSLVVFYTSSSDLSDLLYAVWNGASWSSDQVAINLTAATTTRVVDAVVSADDTITVFARNGTNADLHYVTITAGNSVSTLQTLDANVGTVLNASILPFTSGGSQVALVPFIDANSDPAVYTVTLGGAAPLTTSGPSVIAAKTSAITAASVVYCAGAARFLWYDSTASAVNYSTLTTAWDALTSLASGSYKWGHAIAVGTRIAYVYHSNTSVLTFGTLTPAPVGSTGTVRRLRSQFELRPY